MSAMRPTAGSQEAQFAIEQAMRTYVRAVDRSDFDLFRDVYHPDAVIDHADYSGDVSGFVDYVRSRRAHMRQSTHMLSHVMVDLVGDSLALAEAYGMAVQTYTAGAEIVADGHAEARVTSWYRYVDRFERRDGAWRVARELLVVSDMEIRQCVEPTVFPARWTLAEPSTDDPLYAALAEVGGARPAGEGARDR